MQNALREFIQKAVVAHHRWKDVLSKAIDTGELPNTVENITRDDQCDFGKMLIGDTYFDDADKASEQYRVCKSLHAKFHQQAGRVAGLATEGKKDEARALMEPSGDYAQATGELVKHLLDWRFKEE